MNHTPQQLGTVLVTGGASGLGRAVAAAVAQQGGTAHILDRHEPKPLEGLEIGHMVVDLADSRAAAEAVEAAAREHGGLDAVVTAAGIDACGRLEDVPAEDWERVIRVNLIGTAAVVRAALPHLRRSHGRVVTVGSTLGLKAVSDATAYCASKFGVTGFSRALATELGGEVGVTMLVPGGMQTAFFDGRDEQYRPPADAMLNPPERVADAVLFALRQPPGCEVRELVVTPSVEPSWP
ncbi:short-chain dehydrogenase [Nocardioides gansuensis]|uniref:Short-chain dehydrogenase n=1 Tax=Nocardioides gansuensis TaxID=2138300 RepID=A0A2T8F9T1_9ACTN|nr:SDR family oxidoreductase [Nocardioides gansuensis]PVG82427.1 short-chain dehydrogenase [Nocardioides gansuensis]